MNTERKVIYIDDTGVELDMALVPVPFKFKELFEGCHFSNMEELNNELRVASICTSGHHFGWCPRDKNEFIKRMENRRR